MEATRLEAPEDIRRAVDDDVDEVGLVEGG